MQSDNEFRLTVEGDFYFGSDLRTLAINFASVHALSAHNDMGGITMVSEETKLPKIDRNTIINWPTLRIRSSRWLAENKVSPDIFFHFVLLSYECTVELIAEELEVNWR